MIRRSAARVARLAAAAAPLLAAGCGGDGGAPAEPRPFYVFSLDQHAVTMSTVAPWDTLRLRGVLRTADGDAVADAPAATFLVVEQAGPVAVGADGVVRAKAPVSGAKVAATVTYDGVTLADTARVDVTEEANPPVLKSLSIQPQPGDSARVSAAGLLVFPKQLSPVLLDVNDNPIGGVAVYLRSSNGRNVSLGDPFTPAVRGGFPGTKATIYAEATVYGVTKRDSLVMTVGGYLDRNVAVRFVKNAAGVRVGTFYPDTVRVAAGARVRWETYSYDSRVTDSIDVVFDTPEAAKPLLPPLSFLIGRDSGNIAPFARDTTPQRGFFLSQRGRRFVTSGTYGYHSARYGTRGAVIVE